MTLLTADDVLNKKFQATKFREGYEQDEVTSSSTRSLRRCASWKAENADLKAKLEAANRRVAELGDTAARGISETTVVEPVVQQQQEAPVASGRPVDGAARVPPGRCRRRGRGAHRRLRHARAGSALARRARREWSC